jgi:hypothetical protein
MFRFLGGGLSGIKSASCNRSRTVSGLAGKKNSRRNIWLMRLMPNVGFCCLSSMILSVMASGKRAFRGPEGLGCRPTSPASRYALIQLSTLLLLTPIS